jgi:hypothetical protein
MFGSVGAVTRSGQDRDEAKSRKIAIHGLALLGFLTAGAMPASAAGPTEGASPVARDAASRIELAQYGPGGGSWVDAGGGSVPGGAFPAGQEGPPNYETLFICRTMFNGSVQVGKVRPGLGTCNFAYSGGEVKMQSYQVLVGGYYHWVPWNGGIPGRALQAGYDLPPQSPPLYACQAPYAGGMHPGKTRPDWDSCDISWGGREVFVHGFAILAQ